jgi:hypothetical protein
LSRPRTSLADRFWPRVQKTDGCWLWTGHPDDEGYGQISLGGANGKRIRATAAAWLLTYGYLPELAMLHTCDNPSCIKPDHLFEGTQADNIKDMDAKGRRAVRIGEEHKHSKFTNILVKQARTERESGETIQGLADKYNMSYGAMYKALNRQTWRHI